jgi:hypothetical protein
MGRRDALLALVLCAMMAGCSSTGGGQANVASASPTNTVAPPTATTQPQPTTPPPTPFPAGTFVTYTNTAYHYSIPYPSNWMLDNANTTTSQYFDVYNYNYHLQQFQTPYLPLPLFKVEVGAASNPSHLAPLDFFKQQISQPGQAGPALTIVTSQAARVAGRDAEEVVTTAGSGSNPSITYLVPNGDTLFEVSQLNSQNGQPAPVFAEMVSGFVISG